MNQHDALIKAAENMAPAMKEMAGKLPEEEVLNGIKILAIMVTGIVTMTMIANIRK